VKSLATDIATQLLSGLDASMRELVAPEIGALREVLDRFTAAAGEAQVQGIERMVDHFSEVLGSRLRDQFRQPRRDHRATVCMAATDKRKTWISYWTR